MVTTQTKPHHNKNNWGAPAHHNPLPQPGNRNLLGSCEERQNKSLHESDRANGKIYCNTHSRGGAAHHTRCTTARRSNLVARAATHTGGIGSLKSRRSARDRSTRTSRQHVRCTSHDWRHKNAHTRHDEPSGSSTGGSHASGSTGEAPGRAARAAAKIRTRRVRTV